MIYEKQQFDMERALYNSRDIVVKECAFDGAADGESALKECSNVEVRDCFMNLRYPFWHDHTLTISHCELTGSCRAAIWYSEDIEIKNTKLHGIKALRECKNVRISDCDIISPEFGWSVERITMCRSKAESEYFMMRSADIRFTQVEFKGKYSFQYIKDAVFEDCIFDTKDAFWHGENVIVRNSVIKGEYLGWYSRGLTLEHCKIIGTQPLCYCKNLRLIDCEMVDTDLCFEKSEVEATIITPVISIKNPLSGRIVCPAVEDMIIDDEHARGRIEIHG